MISKYKFWLQDRIAVRVNGPVQEIFSPPSRDGVRVMDEDWDNLIILDGCRVDLFEKTLDIEQFDEYTVRESLGSCTPQWISRNFSEGSFGDTVYISGNAFVSQLVPDRFHDVIQIEETIENLGVVHPQSIRDTVEQAIEQYPDKRFIVHFVQPHIPFIPTPDLIYEKYSDGKSKGYGRKSEPATVHEALVTGAIGYDEWWNGYQANLQLAFEYAIECTELLGGKSVISSDHGNMVGERSWPIPVRHYGHPRKLRASELVDVPWATLTIGERRQVTDDGTRQGDSVASDELDDQLTALGYKT